MRFLEKIGRIWDSDHLHRCWLFSWYLFWRCLIPLSSCSYFYNNKAGPDESHCAVLCLVAYSCPTLCKFMDCSPPGSLVHGESPGKNTAGGCYTFLQGIFPTQGLNPGLPHCRQILYHLSHQGNPRIKEWVAYPFSRGTSWPRNRTGVSCIAGRFFTNWATREARIDRKYLQMMRPTRV